MTEWQPVHVLAFAFHSNRRDLFWMATRSMRIHVLRVIFSQTFAINPLSLLGFNMAGVPGLPALGQHVFRFDKEMLVSQPTSVVRESDFAVVWWVRLSRSAWLLIVHEENLMSWSSLIESNSLFLILQNPYTFLSSWVSISAHHDRFFLSVFRRCCLSVGTGTLLVLSSWHWLWQSVTEQGRKPRALFAYAQVSFRTL